MLDKVILDWMRYRGIEIVLLPVMILSILKQAGLKKGFLKPYFITQKPKHHEIPKYQFLLKKEPTEINQLAPFDFLG